MAPATTFFRLVTLQKTVRYSHSGEIAPFGVLIMSSADGPVAVQIAYN